MDRRGVKGRRQNPTIARMRAAQQMVKAARAAGRMSIAADAVSRTGGFYDPSRSSELKFKDLSTTTSALGLASGAWTTPGATFLLNGLVPDSTATGRIGRKVVMKSLLFRAELRLAATSTAGGYGRYLIVYDRQANTNPPAVTDILLTDAMQSQMNLSNKDRFKIIAEGYFGNVSAQGDFTSPGVEVYKKLNLPVQFNAGTAGTIGDIVTGSVYVLFAQNSSIGTAAPSVVWTSRIRYSDN